MKHNERVWAGHVVSWIQELIYKNKTIFEEVTNDTGIKTSNNKTRFPDILLFTNKISGIIFNGWELKLPDTAVDDEEMLKNALEKAEHLGSNSFVTWNGRDTIIWGIEGDYKLANLKTIKSYPSLDSISSRKDFEIHSNYIKHEKILRKRLEEIILDLESLFSQGKIKESVNISESFIQTISSAQSLIVPQLNKQIKKLRGESKDFRKKISEWEIVESSTLKILSCSPEDFLAKSIYYKLIARIILYISLTENIKSLPKIDLKKADKITKIDLEKYFAEAKKIDYQAVFKEDFTDEISFNAVIEKGLYLLIDSFNRFDFRILPNEVVGNILENLVPADEKQKFGQYFTSEKLTDFVSFPAIDNKDSILLDPTSGTGTFLTSFYKILHYFGKKEHSELLSQIWGNDISQFPATLSVINLYKQNISEKNNFPRIIQGDIFNLRSGGKVVLPNPTKQGAFREIKLPKFNSIISNFPFIKQEKINKEALKNILNKDFKDLDISGRSDFYIYCFYQSLTLLEENGNLGAITSNSWLGKNYASGFKQFLLDNFHIKYIVKSNAEHWFKDSKVSTIFIILEKKKSNENTKFISINFKLEDFLNEKDTEKYYRKIESFYSQVNNCENPKNLEWEKDSILDNVYNKKDGSANVSIISKKRLIESIAENCNWNEFFMGETPLGKFEDKLICPYNEKIIDVFRGIRTGYDKLHVVSKETVKLNKIPTKNLYPVLKNSKEIDKLDISQKNKEYFIFSSGSRIRDMERENKSLYSWVKRIGDEKTTLGGKSMSIKEKFVKGERRSPELWYKISKKDIEKTANIFVPINFSERLFFAYSKDGQFSNQRLAGLSVSSSFDPKLIASLYNSIISLLNLELSGIPRYDGTLDINADFFKSSKIKILDPRELSESQVGKITDAFDKLSKKTLDGNIEKEFAKKERIDFDKIIFEVYGFDKKMIPKLYKLLTTTVKNRVNMKKK